MCFFDNFKDALPAIGHYVAVVDYQLVDSHDKLFLDFMELAVDKVNPWLQDDRLIVFNREGFFQVLLMVF